MKLQFKSSLSNIWSVMRRCERNPWNISLAH